MDPIQSLRERIAHATPAELRALHLAVIAAQRLAQRQRAELAQAAAFRAQTAAKAAAPSARAAAHAAALRSKDDVLAVRQRELRDRTAALAAQLDAIAAVRCVHDMQAIGCAHCRTTDDNTFQRAHGQQTASTEPGDCSTDRPPSRRNYASTGRTASTVSADNKPLRKRDPLSRDRWQGDQYVTVSVASHVPTAGDLTYLVNSAADMIKTSKTARRRWRRKLSDPAVRQTIASTALTIARDESNGSQRVTRLATSAEQVARERAQAAADQRLAIARDARTAKAEAAALAKIAREAAVLADQRKRAHGGF